MFTSRCLMNKHSTSLHNCIMSTFLEIRKVIVTIRVRNIVYSFYELVFDLTKR